MGGAETLTQPIHNIMTGCRGLTGIEAAADGRIFMGFMGTLTDMNCIIQTYNSSYELQAQTSLDLTGNMFTGMKLCLDDKFLVGSHTDGLLSVLDVESGTP